MATETTIKVIPRVYRYNQIPLEDPDPEWSPEQVKEFYANIYPELTQAIIEGPELSDTGCKYTFRKSAGTKGISVTDIAHGKLESIPFLKEIPDTRADIELAIEIARTLLSHDNNDPVCPPSVSLGMI